MDEQKVEITARELAAEFEIGRWRLVALPERYGPWRLGTHRWPRITRAEASENEDGDAVIVMEVDRYTGWFLGFEEVVKVIMIVGESQAPGTGVTGQPIPRT